MLELRATGQVMISTASSRSTRKAATTIPRMKTAAPARHERGRAAEEGKNSTSPALHEPPPRFSEASLVKRDGRARHRPALNYASILQVLKDRGYVKLEKKRLHGEDKGRVVVAFLENFFARYVEYDFTAALEEQLDKISNNEISWQQVLRISGATHRCRQRDQGPARHPGARCTRRHARTTHLRAARGWRRSAPVPDLRHRQAQSEGGKFGAFVGCTTIRNAATRAAGCR